MVSVALSKEVGAKVKVEEKAGKVRAEEWAEGLHLHWQTSFSVNDMVKEASKLPDIIMAKKHSNGSNSTHHIDRIGPLENVTGNTLRIVLFPENYEEAENLFVLLTSREMKEYGEEAKK